MTGNLPQAMRIARIRDENERTRTFVLDGRLDAVPGQFVMAWLPGVDERPFSLAHAHPVTLTVAAVGPFSRALHGLAVGDRIWLRGPLGRSYTLPRKTISLSGAAVYGAGSEDAGSYTLPQTISLSGAAVYGAGSEDAGSYTLPQTISLSGAAVYGAGSEDAGSYTLPQTISLSGAAVYGAGSEDAGSYTLPQTISLSPWERAGVRVGAAHTLLIGGGYGVAPLRFLAERLMAAGYAVSMIIGARTAADLLLVDAFQTMDVRLWLATEDGSAGRRGLATEAIAPALHAAPAETVMVYACGPTGMLRAIASICQARNLPAQLSWEAHMRCAIGLCGSCEVGDGWLACLDGPVFSFDPTSPAPDGSQGP